MGELLQLPVVLPDVLPSLDREACAAGDDALGGEAELLVEHGVGRGRAEVLEGRTRRVADEVAPAHARRPASTETRACTSGGSTVSR